MLPLELVGVRAPEHGSLYELDTTDGARVNLHELDCVGIEYRPVERSLTLTFAVAAGAPTAVVMRFGDARVLSWRPDGPVSDGAHGGQVSDLSWDGGRRLTLLLLDDEITFTAARLTVTTRATGGMSG